MSASPAENMLFQAQQLMRLHRHEEAASLLAQAIGTEPTDARGHELLALCLLGMGRPAEALGEADAAIRLNPLSEWSFRLRSVALVSLGRRRFRALGFRGWRKRCAGIAAAKESVRLAPSEPMPYVQLASAYLANGNGPKGLDAAEQAVRLDPTSSVVFNTLGAAALRLGRLDGAEAAFRKALEIDPQSPEALNNLGVMARATGRRHQAPELFEAAARADPRQTFGAGNATRMSNALIGQAVLTAIGVQVVLGLRALILARRNPWWMLGVLVAACAIVLAARTWRSAHGTYRPRLLQFSFSLAGPLVIIVVAFLGGLALALATGVRETGTVFAVISFGTATRNLGWLRGNRKVRRPPPPRNLFQGLLVLILSLCALGCFVAAVGAAISLPSAPGPDVSGDMLALIGGPLLGLFLGAAAWSTFRSRRWLTRQESPALDRLEAAFRAEAEGGDRRTATG